ncbi:MAG: hypothetical protein GXY05_15710 [Clostridiales bacterium]|nr:hypothetical protein [Clostridiales bacterium]
MDDLLTMFSNEQLLVELEKGHYWYTEGRFSASGESVRTEKPISVENAVFFRFYN